MNANSKAVPAVARAGSKLLTWDQVQPWQRDNDFILTSYRKANGSYESSLWSIWRLHNETTNIWTHLLGMLFFLAGLYLFGLQFSIMDLFIPSGGAAVVQIYMGCVVVCFLLSTFFHTLSDHSQHVHRIGNELDHLGIVLVMWGSGISSTFFGFYCNHMLRNAYILAITTTAVGCGIFTLRPRFRQPSYRTVRFLMYVFLGLSLFAPCIHGLRIHGWADLNEMMSLDHFIGLALVNLSGAAIYAARIPERWYPGKFDLIGQSHNIMHVLVFVGAVVHLKGLLTTLTFWQLRRMNRQECPQIISSRS